jgi:signal transduction histidine kinase
VSRSGSIRWRLVGALVGVSLFTVVVVGAVFYLFLGDYVLDRQEEALLEQALSTAEQIQDIGGLLLEAGLRPQALNMLLRSQVRGLPRGAGIVVFRGEEVVARAGMVPLKEQSLERLREETETQGQGRPDSGRSRSDLRDSGRQVAVLYASAPVTLADGSEGLAVVTLPRSEALAVRGGVVEVLVVSGVIAAVVAIAVGWGLAAWLSRPLRRLSTAARGLAAGHYQTAIVGSYPGEVQELADSLEHTRAEVRHSQESLRGFVASAAHELRTPLTSIQGFSQALLDGTAADAEQQRQAAAAINRESTRLQRLIDALLTLSRYDSREFRPTMGAVAVDVLVAEEVERLVQAGWADAGRVTVRAPATIEAITDGDMLRQAVANLLRNALQYGGDGPVGAEIAATGDRVIIDVWNTGRPLGAEEGVRIFDRFYRGSAARGVDGLGLGLALVKEICGLLGGTVGLVEAWPETRFRIVIPKVPGETGATGGAGPITGQD